MADLNIDTLMKNNISKLIESKPIINDKTFMNLWQQMTRQMFHKFPALVVYSMVDLALEKASDEDYRWFNLPEVKISQKLKIDERAIKIKDKIKITDLADKFNLKPLGKKLRICPFHIDTNPSLSLNNELGVFHCFGCHIKGDIISFYKKLKEVENEKRGS